MSKWEGKQLQTLTKLVVLFLAPPAPFENRTVQPSELSTRIVNEGNESRVFMASVTASMNKEALAKLIPLLKETMIPALLNTPRPKEEEEGSSLVEDAPR